MCTLSFIPKHEGFLVGMNRDELLSRGSAEPPSVHEVRGMKALYPTDVEGGTWIAASEIGNIFAILNRNGGGPRKKQRSRGELVTGIIGSSGFQEVESSLNRTDLTQYLPFRLIGIFHGKQAFEWTWSGKQLDLIEHGWQSRHWFSSGISDEQATESRSRISNPHGVSQMLANAIGFVGFTVPMARWLALSASAFIATTLPR